VNDLAGQEDLTIGKPVTSLIRVVDRAGDALAEAELAREMDDEPPGPELVLRFLDGGHQAAAVAAGEDVRDFVLEVEAFFKD
jgi:hypothetical protein